MTYINTLTRVCTQSHSGCWSDRSVQAQTVLNIAWSLEQEENHDGEMEELLQAFGNPAFSFLPPAALLLLIVAGDLWCWAT